MSLHASSPSSPTTSLWLSFLQAGSYKGQSPLQTSRSIVRFFDQHRDALIQEATQLNQRQRSWIETTLVRISPRDQCLVAWCFKKAMEKSGSCAITEETSSDLHTAFETAIKADFDDQLHRWMVEQNSSYSACAIASQIAQAHEKASPSLKFVLGNVTSLPLALEHLDHLKELHLDQGQASSFPTGIGRLQRLKVLRISNCDCRNLADEIGHLKKLEELELTKFLAADLSFLGKLNNLRVLSLSHSLTSSLPAEVGELSQLQRLSLCKTAICRLPEEVGKLQQLRTLELSTGIPELFRYNREPPIPSSISMLTNLEELRIKAFSVGKIPVGLWQLPSLTKLTLSSTGLEAIPKFIRGLTALQKLDLSQSQLPELPPEISELSGLQSLHLESNHLKQLPIGMDRLLNLKKVNVCDNQLEQIPEELALLPKLETLYAWDNPLKVLPKLEKVSTMGLCYRGKPIYDTEDWREAHREDQARFVKGAISTATNS